MRDFHQKTAALEELLSRVQQKRTGLATQSAASQEAVSPPAPPPPQAPVAKWPTPRLELPQRPSPPRPAPVESRVFESSPTASGDVAHVEGEIIADWSLRAVLSRAFRLAP